MSNDEKKNKKAKVEALVLLVKEGDHDAFSQLYDLFIDQIYRYVFYRVKSTDAEDLVEIVFLKVWENIDKYKVKKKNSFSAWLYRIAHNLVVDYYRSRKDREFSELGIDVPTHDREHNAIRMAERTLDKENLKGAMKNLKQSYQDIILYKFINELTNTEIADILGKSEGSLRILQHRALKALKKEMLDMGIKYEF
ncbi:MAG: sigma-70 family RNA polymerase sigma factor [Nitrospirota bacterium]